MAQVDLTRDARCRAVSYQDVVRKEAETEAVPAHLLEESCEFLGTDDIPVERYTSYEFHRLEVERMWRKVWQLACREEDIPEPGDHIVYEIAEHSLIVVRVSPTQVKAYHNSCLHRGTQLRAEGGRVPYFKCPFHGWSWSLDGGLRSIPAKWDFGHVAPAEFCLPECQVDSWGGFVFLNMDLEAPPLAEYLGVLPEHFEVAGWDLASKVKVAHVAGIVQCNWKVALEAFLESYHGQTTHPQLAYVVGDENTEYDIYGEHVSRLVGLFGVAAPSLRRSVDEGTIVGSMADMFGEVIDQKITAAIEEGKTARELLTQAARQRLEMMTQADLSHVSTTELIDGIEYYVFPNIAPWGGYSLPLVYRFRPNGDDHTSSIMEMMLLATWPDGMPRPAPAPVHWIEGGDWGQAEEIGALRFIFSQDMANLPRIQKGLSSAKKPGVTLGNYQEIRIRHYHETLTRYVAGKP